MDKETLRKVLDEQYSISLRECGLTEGVVEALHSNAISIILELEGERASVIKKQWCLANNQLIKVEAERDRYLSALENIFNLPDNIACPSVKNFAKQALSQTGEYPPKCPKCGRYIGIDGCIICNGTGGSE